MEDVPGGDLDKGETDAIVLESGEGFTGKTEGFGGVTCGITG